MNYQKNYGIAESSENCRWTRRSVESAQDLDDMPRLYIASFSLIGAQTVLRKATATRPRVLRPPALLLSSSTPKMIKLM
jgi:hypothetical protein